MLFPRIPGSEWALRQAKRNVLEKYTLVGVTEKMGEYLQMLELVIPGGMFRNASEHFKHSMYTWSISVFLNLFSTMTQISPEKTFATHIVSLFKIY